MRLVLFAVTLSVALQSGSLFGFKKDPKADAQELLGKKDLPALDEKCQKSGVSYSEYCLAASDLRYLNFQAQTDCAALIAGIEKGSGPFVTNPFGPGQAGYGTFAIDKAIECKRPELIFSKLIWPIRIKQGTKELLAEAAKQGMDVGASLVDWLAKTPAPFDRDGGSITVEALRGWLITQKTPACAALLPFVSKTTKENVRRQWFSYYRDAKCTEAVPVLTEALTSDDTETRVAACNTLGEIGNASVVEKLKILGSTDGVWAVHNNQGVKYYPVRDACLAAAGKIVVRGT